MTDRKIILLHGLPGTGKASLIRFLALRCGDTGPIVADLLGMSITYWPRAEILAVGDYLNACPPGADGYTPKGVMKALRELLQLNINKPNIVIMAEGLPLTHCVDDIAELTTPAGRRLYGPLDVRHFIVSAAANCRRSRCHRKHRDQQEHREKLMQGILDGHKADGLKATAIATTTPASTEAAVTLIASSAGRTLAKSDALGIEYVTKIAKWEKLRRLNRERQAAAVAAYQNNSAAA